MNGGRHFNPIGATSVFQEHVACSKVSGNQPNDCEEQAENSAKPTIIDLFRHILSLDREMRVYLFTAFQDLSNAAFNDSAKAEGWSVDVF